MHIQLNLIQFLGRLVRLKATPIPNTLATHVLL